MIVPHPRKMIFFKKYCMQETMNVACVHFSAGHEVELSEKSKEKERIVAAQSRVAQSRVVSRVK